MTSSTRRTKAAPGDAAREGTQFAGRDRGRAGRPESRREQAQLLERAADLVARGWCQAVLARDEEGRQVEPWSPRALAWSPLGALMAAWYESAGEGCNAFGAAYTALALATGGRLEEWNSASWRTKRHVLSAFVRARVLLTLVGDTSAGASSGVPSSQVEPEGRLLSQDAAPGDVA